MSWELPNYLKVPKYLDDQIRSLPADRRTTPRLRKFHDTLSINLNSDKILGQCLWVSTADGHTCTYGPMSSIARDLDTFQRDLSGADFTVCAINANAGSEPEPFVLWYVSFTIPLKTYVRDLLEIILEDRWPESAGRIKSSLQEIEDRESRHHSLHGN